MIEAVTPPDLQRLIVFGAQQRAVAESALGIPLAEAAGRWTDPPVRTLRTRPGEWLLRDARLPTPPPGLAHVSRLTPGLSAWRLSGPDAATLLAMGGTLDFAGFAPCAGTRTLLARIPALVSRLDLDFEVVVERSLADYFGHWLDAAAQRFA